jgi:hypothetical protein
MHLLFVLYIQSTKIYFGVQFENRPAENYLKIFRQYVHNDFFKIQISIYCMYLETAARDFFIQGFFMDLFCIGSRFRVKTFCATTL